MGKRTWNRRGKMYKDEDKESKWDTDKDCNEDNNEGNVWGRIRIILERLRKLRKE